MNQVRQIIVVLAVLLAGEAACYGDVVARDVTRPDGEADYLVVAPAAAADVLKPLMDLRTRQGRVVKLLPVETIYRGFGDGTPSAEALNRCLVAWRDAPGRKRPVGFVLLVGLPGSRAFPLPTKIVEARFNRGTWGYPVSKHLASDLALVGPSKRDRPVPAVGRLPADTRRELETMVAKTVDYQRRARPGPWRRKVEFVAGQGHYGPTLDGMLENISKLMMRERVPGHLDVTVSYAKLDSPYGYLPSRFNTRLVEAVSRGPALTVYVGHGNEKGFDRLRWRGKSYRLMGIEDVDKLDIPHSRGVMVALACWTARIDGDGPSIGRALLAHRGGPTAFIGAGRISQPYANAVLALALVDHMVTEPAPTVGQALLLAYRQVTAEDDDRSELRKMIDVVAGTQIGVPETVKQRYDQPTMYNLLGDPALSMPVVRDKLTLMAREPDRDGVIRVRVEAPFKKGQVLVEASAPRDVMVHEVPGVNLRDDDGVQQMIRRHRLANDKVLVRLEGKLVDGAFEGLLGLPDQPKLTEVHVSAYAWSDRRDAAASKPVTLGSTATGSK